MTLNNPSFSESVIPAQAGIQHGHSVREADKTLVLNRFAGIFLIDWIPACAGMTVPTGYPG